MYLLCCTFNFYFPLPVFFSLPSGDLMIIFIWEKEEIFIEILKTRRKPRWVYFEKQYGGKHVGLHKLPLLYLAFTSNLTKDEFLKLLKVHWSSDSGKWHNNILT